VARALAPIAKVLPWLRPHAESFDRLLMIKGPAWTQERNQAREAGLLKGIDLRKVADYKAAVTGAESVILNIQAKS
jgi:16S rRNA (guanine527-N7)-methyltransferase